MRVLGAAALLLACVVGFAAPAAAGDQDYLNRVQDRLTGYTPQQLLTEAYKVCAFLAPGRPANQAIPMVVEDLGTSTASAVEIVIAAVVEVPC